MRTISEFFSQLPMVIADMSEDSVLFDTSVFPEDLTFEYTEYAKKIMGSN